MHLRLFTHKMKYKYRMNAVLKGRYLQ